MRNALIAVGGNSLIRAGQKGTIEEQFENSRATAEGVVRMISEGWNVVMSHGNGPQVGAALIRSDRGAGEVYTHTLDMCVATTQSEIGYLLVSAFELELKKIQYLPFAGQLVFYKICVRAIHPVIMQHSNPPQ